MPATASNTRRPASAGPRIPAGWPRLDRPLADQGLELLERLQMHQPGVEVRPLRELTGRAMFNEVFLSDARVSADAIIVPTGEFAGKIDA